MAAPILARQRYLGWAKESPRNTPAASPTKFLVVSDFSPSPEYKYWTDKSFFADVDAVNKKFLEMTSFKAKIKQSLFSDYIGELLTLAVGQVTSAQDATTGAYEHTFTKLNGVELPTVSFFFTGEGGQNFLASGCQVDSYEIDPKTSTITYDIIGLTLTVDGTTRTPTYLTSESILLSRHATLNYADTVALLTGSPTTRVVQDYKFSWKNNIKPDETFSGGAYGDLNAGEREYQHTFSELARDNTVRNWQTTSVRKAWRFRLENTTALIGTSLTYYPRLDIISAPSLAEIKVPDTGASDFVKYEYLIDSERNATAGFACQLKLRNSVASY
jgi:hypothetical protein